jgi:hypothetical protein
VICRVVGRGRRSSDGGSSGSSRSRGQFRSGGVGCSGGSCFGRAFLGDMAWLSALVAGLARSVQWSPVRCSTVAGNVSQFPASIAFHSLGLTVASIVVWSPAFVASRGPVVLNSIGPAKAASIAASTASNSWRGAGGGTVASEMAYLATRVAPSASGTSINAKSRAVGLNMA